MKKKRMVLALVMLALVLVSLNLVLAEDNLTKSYSCLRERIAEKGGYSSLTNEEKAFSLLALSSNATEQLLIKSSIASSLQPGGCLSAGEGITGLCSLKTTGIGLLALTLTGENTSQIDSWLLSQTSTDLNTEWYLEIDSDIAECEIYSGNSLKGKIMLDEDKKISGSLSGCFSQSFGGPFDGYWLKIDPACYNDNITTICNETFVTSLIYKKSDSIVYYIPNTASSASARGKTTEKVNAFCFGTCSDYEGSLWAATALKQKSIDVEKFKPYLYTSSPSYQNLLPSAFLFKISNSGTQTQAYYKTELLNKRASIGTYWQPSDELLRSYYTSLAVWVLGKDTTDASGARDYLKDQLKTSVNGCLSDSIRDTAFALFAVTGSSPAPYIPINITIEKPNQTTVLDTAYPTIKIRINTGAGSIGQGCTYKIDSGNIGNLSLVSGTIWEAWANISTSSYFGPHSVNVFCNNIAGQEKTASKEFNVSITQMNISITKPKSDNTITSQTTTIIGELNTESRECTFSFDDKSKKENMTITSYHSWSGQGTIPVNNWPDKGNHTVTIHCIDTIGNEIDKKGEFKVNLEIPEPPINGTLGITIDNPINNARYDKLSLLQYVNLTTTGTNTATRCVYSIDSGSDISMALVNESNPIKWYAPLNITLEGDHNMTAICTDINGNSAQKTISFIFNTTATTQTSCSGNGYCLSRNDCGTKTDDGKPLDAYTCYSATKICCSENIKTIEDTSQTCYDKGGVICEDNQECEGTPVLSASDTSSCCDGTCRNIIATPTCESKSGQCRIECLTGEEEKSYLCDNGGSCCVESGTSPGKSYWWVWVLLILIILVALGIFFREKIKEFYYKITGKGKGPSGSRSPFGPGPGMPPAGMGMPRRIIPGMQQRPGMMPPQRGMPMRPNMPSARPFPKDKELNETLAKLKNMGK